MTSLASCAETSSSLRTSMKNHLILPPNSKSSVNCLFKMHRFRDNLLCHVAVRDAYNISIAAFLHNSPCLSLEAQVGVAAALYVRGKIYMHVIAYLEFLQDLVWSRLL